MGHSNIYVIQMDTNTNYLNFNDFFKKLVEEFFKKKLLQTFRDPRSQKKLLDFLMECLFNIILILQNFFYISIKFFIQYKDSLICDANLFTQIKLKLKCCLITFSGLLNFKNNFFASKLMSFQFSSRS